MNPSLLLDDPRLCFIVLLAGAVSMLTTLNVAARPAAVETGRVALAFTISSLFFMVTRFANLFYTPLLAAYVGVAVTAQTVDPLHFGDALTRLYAQIQWIVVGAAIGALLSWLLLPTFITLYKNGIASMEYRHSMLGVLSRLARPSGWLGVLRSVRRPHFLGVQLFRLEGVPADFLVANMVASAIWTAGALCAVMASAVDPRYQSTSVLLSGLVNAFAAITFAVVVDPKAALITDQAIHGERPEKHVRITAVHLSAGNFLGACLGLLVLWPGTRLILWAAAGISGGISSVTLVVLLNALVTLLASTTVASRVSAVITRRVATAIAIYNLFFLVTRLAQQVYMPVLGSLGDYVKDKHLPVDTLLPPFRLVVLGASIGAAIALLLLPTFVEIYNSAIRALDREGSLPRLFLGLLKPSSWPAVARCLRAPSLFGVRFSDLGQIPSGFIWGNMLVNSVITIGGMAAVYAGTRLALSPDLDEQSMARAAILLSSVVNGLATITLSLVVDPTSALITDQCVKGERPARHIYITAVFLLASMLIGTLLSQILFLPAAWIIIQASHALQFFFPR